MSISSEPAQPLLSKLDVAQRCPTYAAFLEEIARHRRRPPQQSAAHDSTVCDQLHSSFKTFCSTYRKTHPDEDCSYAVLWPVYIDKNVLHPKQSRQKRPSQTDTSQSSTAKVPRTSSSAASPSLSSSSLPSPTPTADPASSSSSSAPSSHVSCCSQRDVLDEIAKLRSELRQRVVVVASAAHEDQSEVAALRAELASVHVKLQHCEDMNAQQRQQIEQLTRQLGDRAAGEKASLSELATLQKRLDETQQRWHQRDKEHQELLGKLQHEQQTAKVAMERSELSILQGYVLRACDEFVLDCPQYDQPLSLGRVTKERTSRVLNCLNDFTALCSKYSEHAQCAVDASSPEQQVQKAYRKLSLLLHSDKLPALIDGDRKGLAFTVVKVCSEQMKVSNNRLEVEMSQEDRAFYEETAKAKAEVDREMAEADAERAGQRERERQRQWEREVEREREKERERERHGRQTRSSGDRYAKPSPRDGRPSSSRRS